METIIVFLEPSKLHIVFELPMRDGNLSLSFSFISFPLVFELPMRDGNITCKASSSFFFSVFELPMRDGNTSW